MTSKVGFVIRTKNEAVWLPHVLRAVYNQTYRDVCVTVVDSGSTDDTLKIVQSFPDIQLLHIEPDSFSYPGSLNYGISHTPTPYIGILSGHSLPCSSHWLESAVHILDTEPNTAAVTGHYSDLP